MSRKSIRFVKIISLRGPNIWTWQPVTEAWVDIGALEDFPSDTIPGLYERLSAWLPGLVEHRCSVGERGGFLQRLRRGTWAAHILEHVALELQGQAGMPGGFGRARETPRRGLYKVAICTWHEEVTRAALYAGRDLLMAAIEDRRFNVQGAIDGLRASADELRLGPSTTCIVDAANERMIPAIRLSEANLVQLGYGARQRRIWTAETDNTSAIAEAVSRDKDLTRRLLQSCGVPVPEGRLVENGEQAWEAAREIGLPVVVKPSDGNHGRGVFTDLVLQSEVELAYAIAADEGSGVVVERFVQGDEHRLLVVSGRMVAAARGGAAVVQGDGNSTVEQLIEQQLNTDARRGNDEEHPLNLVRLDSAARLELARCGFTADSVPEEGAQVLIQRNGNVANDVTDCVHPEVAAMAELAVRVVGLDIAGVDLVAEDISRPLEEQRGAIVEVNAGPGLLMHLKPASGQARPVGRCIVEGLFPAGDRGYIPIVGVSGSHGASTVARLVATVLQMEGHHSGLACRDGLFFARRHVQKSDAVNWAAARNVLLNRAVTAAVIESDCRSLLNEGLAYERCQVGVVTNVDPAAVVPEFFVHEPDQIAHVLRTQVDVVMSTGVAVLNADDPYVAGMAPLCEGSVIFFGMDPAADVIVGHLAAGERAVFCSEGNVIFMDGAGALNLTPLSAVEFTRGGLLAHQVQNLLAAAAAAWALGIRPELIKATIETFRIEK